MLAHSASATQRLLSAQQRCDRTTRAQHVLTPLTLTLPQGERVFLKERGTALIFALVMLLLLTILGITAVTTSSLQEKMAGNMRDQYMAQQAGDSILLDGQAWVFNQKTRPTLSCPPTAGPTGGIWDSSCLPTFVSAPAAAANWWQYVADSWWPSNGTPSNLTNPQTSQQPVFVVERIQQVPLDPSAGKKIYRFFYRTTGWSVGATDSSKGLIQNVFSKRSDTYQFQ